MGDGKDLVHVIQRGRLRPAVDFAFDGKVNVAKLETLSSDVSSV